MREQHLRKADGVREFIVFIKQKTTNTYYVIHSFLFELNLAAVSSVIARAKFYNFSSALLLVNNSLVNLHTCLAAFSKALGALPLNRSKCGKK